MCIWSISPQVQPNQNSVPKSNPNEYILEQKIQLFFICLCSTAFLMKCLVSLKDHQKCSWLASSTLTIVIRNAYKANAWLSLLF